ncbi:hypothetical protein SU69_04050 [Thermosipho melanesiensis]|uniref:Uncharacterized protein n=2 Tax=Thermosipho melanesiensis TaxID=46541 RepID=A6LL51_THEM4|nr:transporter substrate-binding domain-containing protein [Thermosipho melanesiensis]ABR30652.1 hypothetical protein Tmel_0790 [Thermosipho melanesiensis BI429]APT74852.1 hypothetical protein BW47_04265 [Thermosipho melanesiensis]OOC35727.1 hypothetical protein SU68_04105 [Thermosipho melanesiensis]OOC39026.1 hypothetical protein SU69_04050 [Thermosipho melanesiensis]OOC39174.1 hypothetical protein SU70_04050 [Thermosipho melanesiensis]
MKKFVCIFVLLSSILFARTFVEILDSKQLVIATRNIPSENIYFPENSEKPEFCYELSRGFANYLGVDMKVYVVENFEEYFSQKIFEKVDVISDILTVTPEREKLMIMVPFVSNNEIFISKFDVNVKSVKDFIGKRIITYESFSYYKTLIDVFRNNNIKYVINRVIYEDNRLRYLTNNKVKSDEVEILLIPKGYRYSPYFVFVILIENLADISIFDSLSFAQKYFNALFLKNKQNHCFL